MLSIVLSVVWAVAAEPAVTPLPGPAVPAHTVEVSDLRPTGKKGRSGRVPRDSTAGEAERLYTVRFRYAGPAPAQGLVLVVPLPERAHYVAGSATGPGAVISYSVDDGASFDLPDALTAADGNGNQRVAGPADYTHIRWELAGEFPPGLSGIVSFRARVEGAGSPAAGAL